MLQRYLAGYEPGQSEEYRFCDDPLRAHFLQDHVCVLARAYDFEIEVGVRRVDRPGPEYAEPSFFAPLWTFATNPEFLTEVDQVRYGYALASPCAGPTPGSTATVGLPELEPSAWYDVFVRARSTKPAFKDGALPGVTFRTSRWRDPSGMFAALGFTTLGHVPDTVVTGDLAIGDPSALDPAVILDDDQGFLNALAALGLEGWPPTDEPRLSLLWTQDATGAWLFAGLLIESPEPIHRPGRVDVTGLTAQMGRTGPIAFGISRRDRSGTRLLYLSSTPFHVLTSERITIGEWPFDGGFGFDEGDDPFHFGRPRPRPRFRAIVPLLTLQSTTTLDGATASLPATLTIPAQPVFAGDP